MGTSCPLRPALPWSAWVRRGLLLLGLALGGPVAGAASEETEATEAAEGSEASTAPWVSPNPDQVRAMADYQRHQRLGRLGAGLAWTGVVVTGVGASFELRARGLSFEDRPDNPEGVVEQRHRLGLTARALYLGGGPLLLGGATVLGIAPHLASFDAQVLGMEGRRGAGLAARRGMIAMWAGAGIAAVGFLAGGDREGGPDDLGSALILGGGSLALGGALLSTGAGTVQLVVNDRERRGKLVLAPTPGGVVLAGRF